MKLVSGALAVGYPVLVFAGLRWLEPRWVAALLGATLLVRVVSRWRHPSRADLQRLLAPVLLVAGVIGATFLANDARYLLFVPGLVNLALLFAFARSLRRGPPLVETFARLQHPDLSDARVRYCRTVTRVWCGFFVANGGVAFWLALRGELGLWTFYTGFLAYILMGLLFAVEFVVRSWRFPRERTA